MPINAEKVIAHIVQWLRDYQKKNSAVKGFVVGVSGGIDSAVVSTLCAKTGLPVLVLELPIHQAKSELDRSGEHVRWLQKEFGKEHVQHKVVDLTDSFAHLENTLKPKDSPNLADVMRLSAANLRSRLRMTTLYYFGQLNGYIVVGTGNKVEDFGVGFFTKYGDGGVDISPIADLLKSEVGEVAKALGIHDDIILAAPTDGLYPNSPSDEQQIGASYDEIEWAMGEANAGRTNDSSWTERQKEVFKIYNQRHQANQHKFNPIPVCKIPVDMKK